LTGSRDPRRGIAIVSPAIIECPGERRCRATATAGPVRDAESGRRLAWV